MPHDFPSPDRRHPLIFPDGTVHQGSVFLKNAIDHPRIEVGDYTYASAFEPPLDWRARLVPYLYETSVEKLVIGKFCQIADGVIFVTASANHRYDGFSSYPFGVFDGTMKGPSLPRRVPENFPDTVIGNDVWLGQGARVLPGARIGSGVIIGAGAVVGGTVPDYSVVAGNPGRVVRRRFDETTVARLLQIAWWDWPIDRIMAAMPQIVGGDLEVLEAMSP